MSFEKKITKYAEVAVRIGANVQLGQLLLVSSSVEQAPFARKIVEAAYKAGAGEVIVSWSDGITGKLTLLNASDEVLSEYPQWQFDRAKYYQNRGYARLSISSPEPMLLADVDPYKIKLSSEAGAEESKELREYSLKNKGQWTVTVAPNPSWASMVYPELSEDAAVEELWNDIFVMNRIGDDNNSVDDWRAHAESIIEHGKKLTAYQFKELRFKNSLGTDITIGLIKDHQWAGGMEFTPESVGFVPNLPTEETFCMPHRDLVNGKVYATRPLSVQGKLVKDFWFEFKDGLVTDFGASENYDSLKNLLETDEGAKRLGEIALISYDSPISNMGKLFYNGLIDENASCHMALGNAYPSNIRTDEPMTEELIKLRGGNISLIHCDFMFGTKDLSVIGIDQNGKEIIVFSDGNFAF
ncbi:MAG: aminopeptidase [Candidatus Riflebacteria bacterium]|nr:aminopeptidase [Candidatus Riflebacteria bacterium]